MGSRGTSGGRISAQDDIHIYGTVCQGDCGKVQHRGQGQIYFASAPVLPDRNVEGDLG